MPKIPGRHDLRAVSGSEKAGFKIVRQGKHIVITDGAHFITIPRHNPVNALTMGGIVKDAVYPPAIPRVTVTAELEARSSECGLWNNSESGMRSAPAPLGGVIRVRDYLGEA